MIELEQRCWLCGRNGSEDSLEMHHIFSKGDRKKAEKYGAVVMLCGERCHRLGKYAVHNCHDTMVKLREYGQRKIMEEQGWSVDKFIEEFGKNYLEDM